MKKFVLKILWLDQDIAIAIDHVVQAGYSPLTCYFFWPRHDAWKQIKEELESRPWIKENEKIILLNEITQIINYWQENNKTLLDIQNKFPHSIFCGTD